MKIPIISAKNPVKISFSLKDTIIETKGKIQIKIIPASKKIPFLVNLNGRFIKSSLWSDLGGI